MANSRMVIDALHKVTNELSEMDSSIFNELLIQHQNMEIGEILSELGYFSEDSIDRVDDEENFYIEVSFEQIVLSTFSIDDCIDVSPIMPWKNALECESPLSTENEESWLKIA